MRAQAFDPQQSAETFLTNSMEAARLNDVPLPGIVSADTHYTSRERDELVVKHLPTVRFVARRIHERLPKHVELEDLVSAGMLGLIEAANKFDGSKQIQFKSYAQFRIRGAILDSLRSLDWGPRELRRKGRAMADAIRALSSKLGRAPSDAEIAAEMGMDLRAYQQMTGELKGLDIGSLDLEGTDEAGDAELDFLPAPACENPLTCCMAGQTSQQLAAAIEALPEKERLVLTLYYFEEMTLKEIGLTLRVVESRVSQIRSSALARLRSAFEKAPGKQSGAGRARIH